MPFIFESTTSNGIDTWTWQNCELKASFFNYKKDEKISEITYNLLTGAITVGDRTFAGIAMYANKSCFFITNAKREPAPCGVRFIGGEIVFADKHMRIKEAMLDLANMALHFEDKKEVHYKTNFMVCPLVLEMAESDQAEKQQSNLQQPIQPE